MQIDPTERWIGGRYGWKLRGERGVNTYNITASFQNGMRRRQTRKTPTDDDNFCTGHDSNSNGTTREVSELVDAD